MESKSIGKNLWKQHIEVLFRIPKLVVSSSQERTLARAAGFLLKGSLCDFTKAAKHHRPQSIQITHLAIGESRELNLSSLAGTSVDLVNAKQEAGYLRFQSLLDRPSLATHVCGLHQGYIYVHVARSTAKINKKLSKIIQGKDNHSVISHKASEAVISIVINLHVTFNKIWSDAAPS